MGKDIALKRNVTVKHLLIYSLCGSSTRAAGTTLSRIAWIALQFVLTCRGPRDGHMQQDLFACTAEVPFICLPSAKLVEPSKCLGRGAVVRRGITTFFCGVDPLPLHFVSPRTLDMLKSAVVCP